MGCDIYVFRKDQLSTTPDHGEVFWEASSWDLGYEISTHGFGEHYAVVSVKTLITLADELINQFPIREDEYTNEVVTDLLDVFMDLDQDIAQNSTWFLTLSW